MGSCGMLVRKAGLCQRVASSIPRQGGNFLGKTLTPSLPPGCFCAWCSLVGGGLYAKG